MSGNPREQKFVAGLDKGLTSWLRMREEIRFNEEKHHGAHIETIPEGIKYKYHSYWNDVSLPVPDTNIDTDIDMNTNTDTNTDTTTTSNTNTNIDITNDVKIVSMEQFEQLCRNNLKSAMRSALKATHNRFLEYILDLLINNVNIPINKKQIKLLNKQLDGHGNTALHITAFNGDHQKLDTLLNVPGIKLNILNKHGLTPLFISIRQPMIEFHKKSIQQLLIKNGADINIGDSRGFTALHEACLLGNLGLIELLLKNRAHVYVLDKKNKTPIQYVHKDVSCLCV